MNLNMSLAELKRLDPNIVTCARCGIPYVGPDTTGTRPEQICRRCTEPEVK